MKQFLVSIILFFIALHLNAQEGFRRVFDFNLWDGGVCIKYDSINHTTLCDGAGSDNLNGLNTDIILKIDKNGNKIWDTVISDLDTSSFPATERISFSKDNKVSYLYGSGLFNIYPSLIALNNSSNKFLFRKTYYLPPGQSGGFKDLITSKISNNLYAFGFHNYYTNTKFHSVLYFKLDSSGEIVKQKIIKIDSIDLIYEKTFRNEVTGEYNIWTRSDVNAHLRLTRIDEEGNILFSKTPLINYTTYYNITQDRNGNYVVFTRASIPPFPDGSNLAIILSENGDSIGMKKIYSGVNLYHVILDYYGNFILSGTNTVLKLDPEYNVIWERTLDSNISSLSQVSMGESGSYWITGVLTYPEKFSDSLNYMDLVIYKLDSNGKIAGVNNFGQGRLNDYLKLYPNPTSEKLMIEFEDIPDRDVEIEVVNSNGKKVQQKKCRTSQKCISFHLDNLEEGWYILAIKASTGIYSKKFYYIKN